MVTHLTHRPQKVTISGGSDTHKATGLQSSIRNFHYRLSFGASVPFFSRASRISNGAAPPAPSSSSNPLQLLEQQISEAQTQPTRRACASLVRLARSKNGALLKVFIAHELQLKTKADRNALYVVTVAKNCAHAY